LSGWCTKIERIVDLNQHQLIALRTYFVFLILDGAAHDFLYGAAHDFHLDRNWTEIGEIGDTHHFLPVNRLEF
jgi:hypothetical protein